MAEINVYLTFNGKCREAMAFYQECLGGELFLQTVAESSMANQWPLHVQEHILHASLTNKSMVLLASDMGGSDVSMSGNTISLALKCTSEKEIEFFFSKLSMEGKVTHPLHTFYDGTIGALTDKYGINWILKL